MQDALALGASYLLLAAVAFVYGWAPFLQGPQPLLPIMLSGYRLVTSRPFVPSAVYLGSLET